ncbi:Protein kinase-like domain containing protein [Klebsormidium nitens]|uniref:Protein kinase-like domain containing protein n=1 Tax=Klebsormidium nitens TaxID=105231 RepID=A0A1Y1ISP1_KLENI|nr:Protein kinase-like domain containing protein [Klebsormidium nitens]|eukprot:GAQ91198.1 Protein kinase-like domain containing protein [Klebsormidium nitens]
MASLFSLIDQAFLMPLEHLTYDIREGARDFTEVLCTRLSEFFGGDLLAESARGLVGGALEALLPVEEKAQVQAHWGVQRELVEVEEEETEREGEGVEVMRPLTVREEDDVAGSPWTDCAEGDRQQAPSAGPLPDMAAVPLAAASAPDHTEQRGTGAAEAEAIVAEEEADVSGAREVDTDRSPGASCAEDGQHQAPSAAPLTEVAADTPAAAPAPAAPHTPSPQKEQRGSGRGGSSSARGGLFSSDAFTLPSDDGTLFSDPHFEYHPLPSPDARDPSTILTVDRQATLQLLETLLALGFSEVVHIGGEERAECGAVTEVLGGRSIFAERSGVSGGETAALSHGEALLPSGVQTDMEMGGAGAREEAVTPTAWGQDQSQASTAALRIPSPYSFLEGSLEYYPNVTLDRELGRGGQGAVYLALATRPTGEAFLVAAKVPLACLPFDYLLPEALNWIECASCPNLIPLLGFTIQQDTFIPLFGLADPSPAWTEPGAGVQETPFELYRVAVFAHHIARALAAMHSLGWLHCDVKTDNLLLKDGCPVLADFGLAIHERDAPGRGLCGSRGYIGPEVYLKGYHTQKADIFALGMVIWAHVTGGRPHYGFCDTRALLAWMALGGWYTWPTEVHAHGGDLMALVERCCDANPDRRPTACQLADELHDIAELLCAQCSNADMARGWDG